MNYQPKTGRPCDCKPGVQRDNCPRCEGTGQEIDFAAIRRDPTEAIRREMLETRQPHADLAKADKRWTTAELTEEFEVIGFMAPFCVVKRRSDGVKGSMEFTHSPRFYFNWRPDNG